MISWFSIFLYKKQLLFVLMSLEFVLLTLFLSNLYLVEHVSYSPSLAFYLLVLGACESSVGLSLLIMMTNKKGNDMLKNLNNLLS